MFGETVTRRRRSVSGTDRYGAPTYTWATTDLDGAVFDPGGSVEPVEVGRASVVTTPRVYFRDAVDVTRTDELVVRGVTYRVQGAPARWVSPWTGATAGVVVELEAVSG